MADQPAATVIVSYEIDTGTKQPVVNVTPSTVMVTPGQSIHFRRAGGLSGKMRLTFKDKGFFDCDNGQFATTGTFHEGDGDVRVRTIPGRTTYLCELLDPNGRTIAQSPKDAGGAVEPVKGKGRGVGY